MAKVKICGIRRFEDIAYVNKYMPEYVGFIFAKSKRQVTVEHARLLSAGLDKRICTAGVFVNEKPEAIIEAVRDCRLDIVQIHGDETPGYIDELKACLRFNLQDSVKVWKAFRVKDTETVRSISGFKADAFLLDTYIEDCYGGGGKPFDWSLAAEAGKHNKIILAGGLNEQNVRQAIRIVRPFAVDVSSGVETDGYKDENKVRQFVCIARSYE